MITDAQNFEISCHKCLPSKGLKHSESEFHTQCQNHGLDKIFHVARQVA